jgi:hypothetical protein
VLENDGSVWCQIYDKRRNRFFYLNPVTMQTEWKRLPHQEQGIWIVRIVPKDIRDMIKKRKAQHPINVPQQTSTLSLMSNSNNSRTVAELLERKQSILNEAAILATTNADVNVNDNGDNDPASLDVALDTKRHKLTASTKVQGIESTNLDLDDTNYEKDDVVSVTTPPDPLISANLVEMAASALAKSISSTNEITFDPTAPTKKAATSQPSSSFQNSHRNSIGTREESKLAAVIPRAKSNSFLESSNMELVMDIDLKDDEDTNASGDLSDSEEDGISRLLVIPKPMVRDVSYPNIAASSLNLMANSGNEIDDRYDSFIRM